MVPFAFQLEFIENILACMDRSNSAEDCFCDVGFHLLQKQKLEKELGTEEELGTEKEILEKTMKILKSIRQKTAEIIFDSENGDSRT